MSLAELRQYAKDHKISGVSKLKKSDLLEFLKQETLQVSKSRKTTLAKKYIGKKSKSVEKKPVKRKKFGSRKLKARSVDSKKKSDKDRFENIPNQKETIKISHPLQVEEDLAAKFIIGDPQIHDETYSEEPGEFPLRYGDHKLFAFPRDPEWVFIYWDLQEGHIQKGLNQLNCSREEVRWVLRVLPLEAEDHNSSFFDANIHPDAQSWYLQIAPPGKSFYIELGLINSEGSFYSLIRSNKFTLPPNSPSENINKDWMLNPEQHKQHYSNWSFPKGSTLQNKNSPEPKTGYGLSSYQFSSSLSNK